MVSASTLSLLRAAAQLDEMDKLDPEDLIGTTYGVLHPDLGPALAAWLRFTAEAHEPSTHGGCTRCRVSRWDHMTRWPCQDVLSASWVADVILGEDPS